MKKRPKPFNDLCDIPTDPKRVLRTVSETPGEIAKRTGLHFGRLCERLIEWVKEGKAVGGQACYPDCSIPVFRLP